MANATFWTNAQYLFLSDLISTYFNKIKDRALVHEREPFRGCLQIVFVGLDD